MQSPVGTVWCRAVYSFVVHYALGHLLSYSLVLALLLSPESIAAFLRSQKIAMALPLYVLAPTLLLGFVAFLIVYWFVKLSGGQLFRNAYAVKQTAFTPEHWNRVLSTVEWDTEQLTA